LRTTSADSRCSLGRRARLTVRCSSALKRIRALASSRLWEKAVRNTCAKVVDSSAALRSGSPQTSVRCEAFLWDGHQTSSVASPVSRYPSRAWRAGTGGKGQHTRRASPPLLAFVCSRAMDLQNLAGRSAQAHSLRHKVCASDLTRRMRLAGPCPRLAPWAAIAEPEPRADKTSP